MELLFALWNVVLALWALVVSLVTLLAPWLALFAWVALWLGAVNWKKLSPLLLEKGGITGVLLIAFMAVLVWGSIAPPADGAHHIIGLTLSNWVGKTVYVSALVVIALLCGSVQISGCCNLNCGWEDDAPDVSGDVPQPSH